MKRVIRLKSIISSLLIMALPLCASAQAVRQKINIDREWKFVLADEAGAEAAAYNDTNWRNVNIPHNFSEPYFQAATWYTGYGWYRKHFALPGSWKGKRIFVEFEGAFREAEIFVNGQKMGTHQSGYTGFSIDITPAIHTGDNVLAVRLNNLWNAQLAPLNGDHNFTGGIYRDVYLVATNPVHVTWYGAFVSTPNISQESGTVNIKTEIKNDGKVTEFYRLKTTILDPSGKPVDTFSTSRKIAAGETVEYNQTGHSIPAPKLWHPQHPYLYKAVSTLYKGKKVVDRYETPFGFRWIEWTAGKGFFLNGERYYFRGANVHQDHAGWASAVTNTGIARDVRMVKDAGFDFIRGSHYPHDPAFAEACDSLGVLFWSENNFWGAGGFSREGSWFSKSGAYPVKAEDQPNFETSLKNSLRDMIRTNRNHPSIITWSMCNEAFFTENSTLPRVREFLKELVALTHELDPTRKAAVGGAQRGDLDKTGDIAGYNGDGARLFINPGIPSVVSEYGSTIADRPGKYEPGFGDLENQPPFEWRSGQAIWCAFDYGTTFGRLGRMGIIDYQRIPKRAWYWYRHEYKKIPPPEWPAEGIPAALQLTADKTVIEHPDGSDDVHLMVTVLDAAGKPISNSPGVTFTLVSGPGEFPTGSTITFSEKTDIPIQDGKAAIEFRSYYSGSSLIRAASAGLKDAYITIFSKGAPVFTCDRKQIVTERPYVRFEEKREETPATGETNFTFNKPTHPSSELEGHSGRLANDQDTGTWWSAKTGAIGEWLTIDLENTVTITAIKLFFPKAGNYRYKLQVTADGDNWVDVSDQSNTISTEVKRTHNAPAGTTGRSVRILFAGLPEGEKAAVAEMEVFGEN
ncbi:MAG TPA: glycoside hydrolase family 2 TIM barrel-domain containing protein [Puia sp.]|nr:glycoside hydrolase family 2 TIM barrel-domain containing protein [Puia sp.]